MARQDIYVISDLHIGGAPQNGNRPSFQMCPPESRRRLARFVHHLRGAALQDASTLELIINGDFVDFLAEEPFASFTASADIAVEKLRRIISAADASAPEGEQVFPALRAFVTDGHRLTVLLGNHDLELSLAPVRHELLHQITGGRAAHVEFLFDGEACRRGSVLLEHGNRYDGWNAVAHGALRAFRARASRGEPEYAFPSPAGSLLVTEVMTPLKGLYKFIDLLKPENEAVVPILCALHPSALLEIRKVFNAWRQRATLSPGAIPEAESYVAAWDSDDGPVPDAMWEVADRDTATASRLSTPAPRAALSDELVGDPVDARTIRRTEAVLAECEAMRKQIATGDGEDVVPDEYSEVGDGVLAWVRSSWSLGRMGASRDIARYQHLRNALVSHRHTIGAMFALDSEAADYLDAARRLATGDCKFVIFGHTHVAKSIDLGEGRRYLNTGTWCPTIQLDERLYQVGPNDADAVERLQQFVEDMGANRVGPWTSLRTMFAHLVVNANGDSTADLCEFHDDGRVTPCP
jgi:UDP-2,3-diacylglucosamine pyrophosphatase LpxH